MGVTSLLLLASDAAAMTGHGASHLPLLARGEVSGFQVPGAITSKCWVGLLPGIYERCKAESTDLTYSSVVTDE